MSRIGGAVETESRSWVPRAGSSGVATGEWAGTSYEFGILFEVMKMFSN